MASMDSVTESSLDSVGDGIDSLNAAWSFGGNTPKNFDSHVSKSVPKYHDGHDIILSLSDFFINKNSVVYELGSSTGALTRKMAKRHSQGAKFVGIDIEEAMTQQANILLAEQAANKNVTFLTDDILNFPYEKSDFIVAYYTVQFIPPRVRQQLFDRIYQSLNWGGAFVLFEKVRGPDARFQDIISSLYVDYKVEQGYAAHEILAKSRSLKGVLEPFSTLGNQEMLNRAGFVDVMTIFKHICFEGFFSIK
ncbi:methyltransferase domain-containing protein [Serratia sp. NPDC087055]|uniref:methyltransferase domain-containing protein n=1 Tax=Serratia sp. NPDC087055 TaxID=3364516 RepID=UPI00384F1636